MQYSDGMIKRGQWLDGKFFGGDQVSEILSTNKKTLDSNTYSPV